MSHAAIVQHPVAVILRRIGDVVAGQTQFQIQFVHQSRLHFAAQRLPFHGIALQADQRFFRFDRRHRFRMDGVGMAEHHHIRMQITHQLQQTPVGPPSPDLARQQRRRRPCDIAVAERDHIVPGTDQTVGQLVLQGRETGTFQAV